MLKQQIGTTPFSVEFEETYTYGRRHGRVSGRATAAYVNSTPAGTFSQGWTYTPWVPSTC